MTSHPSQSGLQPQPTVLSRLSSTATHTMSSLSEQIEHLHHEFCKIAGGVLKAIKFRRITSKDMLTWFQALPKNLSTQFSEVLQANTAISNASNSNELLQIVTPYWNMLHPALLEHFIGKLEDKSLKTQMSRYKEQLRQFRSHTSLDGFIDQWVGAVPSMYGDIVLGMGDEWREMTLEALERFRMQLSQQQGFGGHMIYMTRVAPGNLVFFAVAKSVLPINLREEDLQYFLREEKVIRISVEDPKQFVFDLENVVSFSYSNILIVSDFILHAIYTSRDLLSKI